jgi:plasmid maintenance system antidote protein VapI
MAENNMRLIHPGEILREEYLVPLGMSANALSIALRVPAWLNISAETQKGG